MNKSVYVIGILLLMCLACDPDLFKQKQAPQIISINSNKGFIINPGDTITLTVEATNPEEGELSYSWSASSFVFLSGKYNDSVVLKAPFAGGTYSVKVKVSNAEKSSEKGVDVVVRSMIAPLVRIIEPQENSFLVQFTTTRVEAEAIHENGIFRVWLLVNDTLEIIQTPQNQGNRYIFTWDTDFPHGQVELKVTAEANITGTKASDSVRVYIEGVIPGKK